MPVRPKCSLGLDFGTESVRALLVDLTGMEVASAVVKYPHGQIIATLPGSTKRLPVDYALQHPSDWMGSASQAVRKALKQAGTGAESVVGIGVDFTSCTMLPARSDGTPLCLVGKFANQPLAWPKLWKHHGAKLQTDRINQVARQRNESFLDRYGGTIGLEWFFPKVLETLEMAPAVYEATEVWLEAGDWFVWQLVGGPADELPRSTCQAGYKAMWSAEEGYPSADFFAAVHPGLKQVVRDKVPGRHISPGETAGGLTPEAAKQLGLRSGTPVSAAIIDAHAGVPGAGAADPGTLVMVMGTSSCHMLNSTENHLVPGVAGIVAGGILPGYYGYETGQAAVGDAFDWLRRLVGLKNFDQLTADATKLPPGADGVRCVDWLNGCRTPLMNGHLRGAFSGLALHHTPAHLYRALLEASAYGVKWIVELLRVGGVPVEKLIATGGLPHHNQLLVQIYADVMELPITIHPCKHGPALGAAILGALAAGPEATKFSSPTAAIRAMAAPKPNQSARKAQIIRPQARSRDAYRKAYQDYRQLAEHFARST
ncbi:MAG: ribulokinase [Pirellulales bacterium]